MQCPRCDAALEAAAVEGEQIDKCPSCGGLWFGQGELRAARDAAQPDLRWLDFEIWKHEDRFRFAVLPFICPQCEIPMVAVTYGDTDVEVDCCPQCQGMWLDAGEFGKIVNALEKEVDTKSTLDYAKATLEEATELITGPESRISEWRDLKTVVRLFQYRVLAEGGRFGKALELLQQTGAGRVPGGS